MWRDKWTVGQWLPNALMNGFYKMKKLSGEKNKFYVEVDEIVFDTKDGSVSFSLRGNFLQKIAFGSALREGDTLTLTFADDPILVRIKLGS